MIDFDDRDDCPVPSCSNTKLRTSQICGTCWNRLGNVGLDILHDPGNTADGLEPDLLKKAIERLEADRR